MKQKYYIIMIVLISAIGVGKHYYDKKEFNALVIQVKEDLEREKKNAVSLKDSILLRRNSEINLLIEENEKAKAKSAYWYTIAKRKNLNPDYDIDFITAANILANSKYRPTKPKDSIRQESYDR
ncbi:hypothetical protein [Tenacibaculum maritimum]|uniref:hypothetical protein n=1 Tax=Tenacibaculum maritimum TaxID=107401 RepID=UPI003876E743